MKGALITLCAGKHLTLHSAITISLKNQKQRWLLAFKQTNQSTQEVENERFIFGLDKTMCKFYANFAFDKATNGQTDTKYEMW